MSTSIQIVAADQLDEFPDDGKRRETIGGEPKALERMQATVRAVGSPSVSIVQLVV